MEDQGQVNESNSELNVHESKSLETEGQGQHNERNSEFNVHDLESLEMEGQLKRNLRPSLTKLILLRQRTSVSTVFLGVRLNTHRIFKLLKW